MNGKLVTLAGIAALMTAGQALAGTCEIESTRAAGEWTFVRVLDVDTGKIVLQRAIKGGDHYKVEVSQNRVRVDSKLPGGTAYGTGTVVTCKGGNRIRV